MTESVVFVHKHDALNVLPFYDVSIAHMFFEQYGEVEMGYRIPFQSFPYM